MGAGLCGQWEGMTHTQPGSLADLAPLCSDRFPFYYELKMAFVLWLLSPYTKGASLLYRKFVHPSLSRHEKVPRGRQGGKHRGGCERKSPKLSSEHWGTPGF